MAASLRNVVRMSCRLFFLPKTPQIQKTHGAPRVSLTTPGLHRGCPSSKLSSSAGAADGGHQSLEALSRYRDQPWEYLESEEYIERYGSKPIWSDYRRNHKGGIPPQKTRKTCIRGDKICGNPCPICRDPSIIIHYKNVNLLQQFISPYTGIVYDPTRTGVCRKQQKLLDKAIEAARDHGLISSQLPFVDYSSEDYSNSHGAVSHTPAPPMYTAGKSWYPWYGDIEAAEQEVARVKKIYKAYLK